MQVQDSPSATQQLTEALARRLDRAMGPNTLQAYRSDNLNLIAWCEQRHALAYPASTETLVAIVRALRTQSVKAEFPFAN